MLSNATPNFNDQQAVLLDHALAYARCGWSIIPVIGKKSAGLWKPFQTRAADEKMLRQLFAKDGITGLAVVLGQASGGLTCRDFDRRASYERWATHHPDLAAKLPTVETARGRHVYFQSDQRRIKNLGDGELRGAGYCLLPPSRHPDGPIYRWINTLGDAVPQIHDLDAAGLLSSVACDREDREDRALLSRQSRPSTPSKLAGDPVERAIVVSLPHGPGTRNRLVFKLCRELKALPPLADADPRELKPIVKRWHELALPVIGTKPFEETWIDFLYGWPRVKWPAGSGPLDVIFARAAAAQLPQTALAYEQPQLRLLVSLCRELQRVAGDEPFWLGCRSANRLLGVDRATAARWLWLLTQEGILELVEKGSAGTKRASRYRYVADEHESHVVGDGQPRKATF